MNQFGDERKLTLRERISPDTAEIIRRICDDIHPVMLGVTRWECFAPWQVPERRICDNFLLAVVSGEEQVSVCGVRRILRRGDWIAVPEFVPHSFGLAPGCTHSEHFIGHALFAAETGTNPFAGFDSPFLTFAHPDAEFAALERIVALRNFAPESAMRLARQRLIGWMIAEAGEDRFHWNGGGVWDERIRSALRFIDRNFAGSIGVPDIAAAAHLGEVRLRTRFRNATGMTPGAYLLRARLLYAARRLARYEDSVADIAKQSGFSSPAHFCTAFKAMFRHSPGAFRESVRGV